MIKAYMSHPIRGPLKDKATSQDMRRNNEYALEMADMIRSFIPTVIDLYVPAEHEAFVTRAWKYGYLSENQILVVDCAIIQEHKDVLLVFAPYGPPVGGCSIEIICANDNDIPVIIFETFGELVEKLTPFLKERGLM